MQTFIQLFIIILGIVFFGALLFYIVKIHPKLEVEISKIIKKIILIGLWAITIIFIYLFWSERSIFPQESIYEITSFSEVKNNRYQSVIKKLKDIRNSQLAHKNVKGFYQNNWDSLVKFIEVDSFKITQRVDTSILDKGLTKRYGGVKTYKDTFLIETLGFFSVKDSLFNNDLRYKNMMYVPFAEKPETKFELRTDILSQDGNDIPVFEVLVDKSIILYDQPINLVLQENEVKSVDGVNGKSLKIGSLSEVNTNGNWPKNYSKEN